MLERGAVGCGGAQDYRRCGRRPLSSQGWALASSSSRLPVTVPGIWIEDAKSTVGDERSSEKIPPLLRTLFVVGWDGGTPFYDDTMTPSLMRYLVMTMQWSTYVQCCTL